MVCDAWDEPLVTSATRGTTQRRKRRATCQCWVRFGSMAIRSRRLRAQISYRKKLRQPSRGRVRELVNLTLPRLGRLMWQCKRGLVANDGIATTSQLLDWCHCRKPPR
jgi:hypothetical protein